MNTKEITSRTDLENSVRKLNATIIAMCNEKNKEAIIDKFVECKDLLIAIYKYLSLGEDKNASDCRVE